MQLIITNNYDEMSQITAHHLSNAIKAKPNSTLVVAVGNTPLGTFKELARLHQQDKFDTSHLRLFQLDEYLGIPTSDHRSLYGWVKRDFMDPLGISESQITPLPTSNLPNACRAYDNAIAAAGGIDITILGLGPNGHLGFNEPPADPQSLTHTINLTEESIVSNSVYWGGRDQVPLQAITCGLSQLLSARHILLPVSGSHKRDILWHTLKEQPTPAVPSSYLQHSQNVTIITDTAAWPH